DRMHGLNEYDFSARWQDAANPGFTTVDPLAELAPWDSPYAYCGGDPVNKVDPTGMNYEGPEIIAWGHDYSQDRRDGQNYANYWSSDHSDPNSGDPLMDGQYGSYSQNGQQSQSSVPENKDQVLKDGGIKNVTNVYEKAKPAIDAVTTALEHKVPKMKGLGKYITVLDISKDIYLYTQGDITDKRFIYRTIGNAVSVGIPLAGPSVTFGEIMYDQLYSTVSWINNTFTTQNFLNSNLFQP
ncbi:MAG: RHS repeat-associated core domain-containing protein, partial [Paludibacter sp.]